MADNVLQEYLVVIRYKLDEAGKKRFDDALLSVGKLAAAMAASLTAATAAIGAAVQKIATEFDSLYFSAQRTNTSVANIKAYTYALSQLGISAGAANGAIEAVASAIRTNPGNESLIRTLGVQTRDAAGNLRDTVDVLTDLDKVLSSKPQYIATQYWAALGLDEGTANAMRGHWAEIQKGRDDYLRKAAEMGVNPDKAAEQANKIMTSFRDLQSQIDLAITKIAQELAPQIIGYLNQISKWIVDNKDNIVSTIKRIAEAFIALAQGLGEIMKALTPILHSVKDLGLAVFGEKGLNIAFAALLAYVSGAWLTKMLGVADKLSLRFLGIMALISWIAYQSTISAEDKLKAGQANSDAVDNSWFGRMYFGAANTVRGWFGMDPIGPGASKGNRSEGKGHVQHAANMSLPAEARALLDTIAGTEAPDYNVMYGGGRFSDYSDHPRQPQVIQSGPNAGKTTTAAGRYQFLASTWDEVASQLGLKDFSPESQDAAAWSLAQSRYAQASGGRNLLDDLQSNDPNLLAYIGGALSPTWTSLPGGVEQGQDRGEMARRFNRALAGERARSTGGGFKVSGKWNAPALDNTSFTSPFSSGAELPLLPAGAANTGIPGVALDQKTTINVYGSSDPHITAAEVVRKQGSVNASLLGNVKGAVQ